MANFSSIGHGLIKINGGVTLTLPSTVRSAPEQFGMTDDDDDESPLPEHQGNSESPLQSVKGRFILVADPELFGKYFMNNRYAIVVCLYVRSFDFGSGWPCRGRIITIFE